MTGEELEQFYYGELQWCGCGDSETALRFLGEVLAAVEARYPEGVDNPDPEIYRKPLELVGMEEKPGMAYGYLYTLDSHGLIEHGSSIRSSWITEKGRSVLRAIEAYDWSRWGEL